MSQTKKRLFILVKKTVFTMATLVGKIIVVLDFSKRQTINTDLSQLVEIRMLASHTMIHNSICALKSFSKYSGFIAHTYLHDDGTLTWLDKKLISWHFPNVQIISLPTFDSLSLSADLQHVLNWQYLKAYYIPSMTRTKKLLYIDADIIFLSKPQEIIQWIKYGNKDVFMSDFGSFNLLSPGEFDHYFQITRVSENINTGIMCLNTKEYKKHLNKIPKFLETCWDIFHTRLIGDYENIFNKNYSHLMEQTWFSYYLSARQTQNNLKKYKMFNTNKYGLFAHVKEHKNIRSSLNMSVIHFAGPSSKNAQFVYFLLQKYPAFSSTILNIL